MEKRKQIDVYDLKEKLEERSYPIGFDFENTYKHRKNSDTGRRRSQWFCKYGMTIEDMNDTIDDVPSVEEPEGALEKLEERYNDLEEKYTELKSYTNLECSNKKMTYGDIKYALDRVNVTLTNEQFLELLKSELDHPSHEYEREEYY